ncbi:MAG TPA: NAD(P)H-binding protein, partial [Gemmatimonadales bacterium]|nr:NAD(P)H-binding protein [Gemmatimonadales bacterium]
MAFSIVITGATGHVGNALAGQLLAQGHGVRVVSRSADRLAGLIAKGAQPWIGSLDDPKFMAR